MSLKALKIASDPALQFETNKGINSAFIFKTYVPTQLA